MNTTNSTARQWNESSSVTELPLRDNPSMFQLLFDRSADAIFLFDPRQQMFVDCNQAAVAMMCAKNKQQLLMVHPAELSAKFQPDGRSSLEKTPEMTQLALAKGSHRFEWLIRRIDGTEFAAEVLITVIQTGEHPLMATICRDISDRKKNERAILDLNAFLEDRVTRRTAELLRANEQLKYAEHQSRERAAQMEKHRNVLLELAQANKCDFPEALQKICSLAASTLEVARVSYWSLIDQGSAIVCDHLHLFATGSGDPKFKGVQLGLADCPAYFEALATKRPIVAHNALEHPGTKALGESYLKPLGISSMLDAPVWVRGEVVGVLCSEHIGPARNWTPEEIDFASSLAAMVSLALEESRRTQSEQLLRESEGRFSAAFRASPVFITISRFDDGRYILANEAFLKWTEYRLDEVLGRNSGELNLWTNPADRALFWEELNRTGSIRDRECQVRNRNGKNFTVLLCADIIEIKAEPHLLTVGLDITQRKLAEAELLKTVAREKELGVLRSKFVSMVSHEFRTPLSIIQSSAEILDDYLDRLNPEERKDHLRSINKNTRRMASIMEEVLLIGSFDAEKIGFKPAPLDLQQFARRLVDEVLSATDRRCPIELILQPTPGEASADERLLRHIFTNLLTNAVKYSEAGQAVQLEIAYEGIHAICVIRDRGIGIPVEDREWMFNAFHRGRNVGNRQGTGLGLVIVKRCVDSHCGKITVDSTVDLGTTMTVRLPMFESAAANASPNLPPIASISHPL